MTNKEFIAELAQRTGYSPEDTQRMVNLLVETMGDRFQDDDTVLVPTFGTFEVKKKLERVMVNPSTGQRMLVPPKLVLNFKPNVNWKERRDMVVKVKGFGTFKIIDVDPRESVNVNTGERVLICHTRSKSCLDATRGFRG